MDLKKLHGYRDKESTMKDNVRIGKRLNFYGLNPSLRSNFADIVKLINRHAPTALDNFYEKVAATPEAARYFGSRDMMKHASDKQLQHWRAIFENSLDDNYYGRAEVIGKVHARIGLDASLYFGAYSQILGAIIEKSVSSSFLRWIPGVRRLIRKLNTLVRVALLDMDISVSTIFLCKEEEQKKVIEQVGRSMLALAQGDLCAEISDLPKEYEKIGHDFTAATTGLREMMSSVSKAFANIQTGATEISAASEDLARRTEQQAAALEETAAALRDLTMNVKQTAEGAGGVREAALEANQDANTGSEVVGNAVTAMGEIDKSSSEIEAIVDVIDGIAFQTNLLALNAGVEAARAGDAGKGFAVVANEVRALAQRSAEAAKDIKALISQSSGQVESGVNLVGQTGKALDNIVQRVREVTILIQEIASKSESQATSIQQVNVAVSQMDQMTQQNAAMVEQSTAAAKSLADQANRVSTVVAQFKIVPASPGERPSRSRTTEHGVKLAVING